MPHREAVLAVTQGVTMHPESPRLQSSPQPEETWFSGGQQPNKSQEICSCSSPVPHYRDRAQLWVESHWPEAQLCPCCARTRDISTRVPASHTPGDKRNLCCEKAKTQTELESNSTSKILVYACTYIFKIHTYQGTYPLKQDWKAKIKL